jgi:hypothetical protein
MFGLLKENIINNLEQVYVENGEKDFKKQFHKFISIIKESKDLKKMYNLYETINEVEFNDEAIAKEFVEESIIYLKKLDRSKINLIEGMADIKSQLPKDSRGYYLDQLVFNENISIKNKVECKVNLIRSLVKEQNNKIDFTQYITTAETKLNEKLNSLTEEQQKVVQLLAENDTESINSYYSSLINEAQSLIDDRIIEAENKTDTVKKLIEAKKKLKSLSTEVTPGNIELILDLKGSL